MSGYAVPATIPTIYLPFEYAAGIVTTVLQESVKYIYPSALQKRTNLLKIHRLVRQMVTR
jgi:hypothetical protein